ncbi:uncharacterized protein L969DRAFT_46771 [Mixia osmundae IAM 14324]|uniref:Uncharacterized protein n=1 Tax=Mixia osmundae (strain CBS 9802 / IAM 14324 / JCM 22182 / KY 12970) TaxID=764103 RepID=G7DUB4_MIXOS|nr:uncharacterized protein L969DRAFT_46771 [Mixia osmundae IAM 14324]KEI41046.1 hypothetical protein L969DRAFT_46771 [Mixia osmundae IAM 14324]GAA94174.1 hypothetical protein E5Q_00822 [Mixia osmundae IAM 14324]
MTRHKHHSHKPARAQEVAAPIDSPSTPPHAQSLERPTASSSTSEPAHNDTQSQARKTKWQAVRPWKPPVEGATSEEGESATSFAPDCALPSTPQSARFLLQVIDVTSTAVTVALSPNTTGTEDSATVELDDMPTMSIKLDGVHWPHVFYSGTTDGSAQQSVIVIFGLSPGKTYDIDVTIFEPSQTASGDRSTDELEASDDAVEEDIAQASRDSLVSTTSSAEAATESPRTDESGSHEHEEDAPPPYSSHDPISRGGESASEDDLRALLKKERLAARQAEHQLQASIASLKRTLEKANRDDTRARSRIATLESEAIRLKHLGEDETLQAEAIQADQHEVEEKRAKAEADVAKAKMELDELDRLARAEQSEHESTMTSMRERLYDLTAREEGLRSEKQRCERDILPELNAKLSRLNYQLVSLEEDPASVFRDQSFSDHSAFAQASLHSHFNVKTQHDPHATGQHHLERQTLTGNRKRSGSLGKAKPPLPHTSVTMQERSVPGLSRH